MRLSMVSKIYQSTVINVIVEDNATDKARAYQILRKFNEQVERLKVNPRYPSLHYQPLTGGQGLWRFRVTKKYWGITLKPEKNTIRVINVVVHL